MPVAVTDDEFAASLKAMVDPRCKICRCGLNWERAWDGRPQTVCSGCGDKRSYGKNGANKCQQPSQSQH